MRPIRGEDWPEIDEWGRSRDTLWGPYQRFQLDHVPLLRQAYEKTGLLTRDTGFFLIERLEDDRLIGFIRYTLLSFPDADLPYPEIGFGVQPGARGKGYATEAARLLLDYLFSGYPTQKVAAFTDVANKATQCLLEKLGFVNKGVLRRATFRDGRWCDLAAYSVLREEWAKEQRTSREPAACEADKTAVGEGERGKAKGDGNEHTCCDGARSGSESC